jgi:hypothetical protein
VVVADLKLLSQNFHGEVGLTTKSPERIADLLAQNLSRDVPNIKPE